MPNQTNPNDAGFSVFYNGQKITKENNLVTIYDKDAFSLNNLSVFTSDVYATVEIVPQFETVVDGYNYVMIVCRSANGIHTQRMQVVFDLHQYVEPAPKKDWLKIALWAGIPTVVVAIGAVTTIILVKKRRKKRACKEENV